MPPRLPSAAPFSRLARRKPLDLFFCPACSIWRLSRPPPPPRATPPRIPQIHRLTPRSRRKASSLASSTAINAPIEVLPKYKEVYSALERLKTDAGSYVNLSRLQLALRGLEGHDAVVRVAVLSLGEQKAARKLVRLLLADPLGEKEKWEQVLEESGVEDERGLLVRYGEEGEPQSHNLLLRTLSVPSRVLRRNNLEILISTLNLNVAGPGRPPNIDRPKDAILVPTLQTPTSFSGRMTPVTHPVHRALLLGSGLQDAVEYGRYTAGEVEEDTTADTVKLAISMPAPETEPHQSASDSYAIVDPQLASKSLDTFRTSIAESVAYEHGWFRSGMPAISEWLEQDAKVLEGTMKPAVKSLIVSLLDDAESNLMAEDAQRLAELVASSVPEHSKQAILDSLKVWAENAHTELRDQLDIAFAGKHWRKITWWKLFWRVDDVAMIMTDVLERRWLQGAERGIIYVAGRLDEATSPKSAPTFSTPAAAPQPEHQEVYQARFGMLPPPPTAAELAAEDQKLEDDIDAPTTIPHPNPWPQYIPLARATLSATTVPTLQALAQKVVLQTLSTVSLTSALSALMFVSISTTSVFEAGGIAALGLVWSLRRMQKRWEDARDGWEEEVREEGRRTLKVTEERMRGRVEEVGRVVGDVEGAEERRGARGRWRE
ncbi:hypothetical protein H2199_006133 [Coniosporium tulheliwenetii]|uniref:Uncharacterized protein n=1 Tax=Coniosporium tulheliwenetii TaxID=3383036 RepID=A0ACC2YX36_9PEZI|nr:hypothetical protein H2199_006133 [Cladosporium sp. JES 115]